ncbi:MAG: winged helix DNA-binding domain-containing protein [Elusimicrobia bacterium]|nr:winged helix DNA-binding domain-containing protein [Elusimicrobiota bacterium]
MKPITVEAVRRLFLKRQHLDRPLQGPLNAKRLQAFVEDTGGLQLDSINVIERAHYLSVWSRFGAYDKAALDRLAYEDRLLYEYWAHAACLVPRAHLPAWRRAMLDYRTRHTGWSSWLKANGKMLREVESVVADKGPVTAAVFTAGQRTKKSTGWWDWMPGDHALHFLWMTGKVAVHSRPHFRKRYDLSERVVDLSAVEPLSAEEFHKWHVRQSLHAMGAATAKDLGAYLSFPRFSLKDRRGALRAMLESGEVSAVAVKGLAGEWFALREDLPALQEPGPAVKGTTLLCPFDSFLWHRQRTLDLFGFDYKIEVYVPAAKRRHGYYCLPILHDGRLIGRLDAKNSRQDGRLLVPAVHFEEGFPGGDGALAGLAKAFGSLEKFVGAGEISVGRVFPAALADEVRRRV